MVREPPQEEPVEQKPVEERVSEVEAKVVLIDEVVEQQARALELMDQTAAATQANSSRIVAVSERLEEIARGKVGRVGLGTVVLRSMGFTDTEVREFREFVRWGIEERRKARRG